MTAKQIKQIEKAKALILQAKAIIAEVEPHTKLRYSRNGSANTKLEDVIHLLTWDI